MTVDSKFNLRCSLLEDAEIVAHNLIPNRWYHVALTLDWGLQRQNVYLDGVNVSSDEGHCIVTGADSRLNMLGLVTSESTKIFHDAIRSAGTHFTA